ncbi:MULTISPECIES: M23 family metallopeptidase [unclassified Curtobacterium]|uniref:M23 family metallopeptidase n=1 Tax=unclassified Curtobacterium TaxID=257496 RepID=UPI00255965D5|nr:M23 family metallopeptidase [Curtobacterium sp. ODYSSEY 48 V2]
MTTTHDTDQQQPETPVVHLSRRAALEAERAAAGKAARRTRAPRPSRSDAAPAVATVSPAPAPGRAPESSAAPAPAPAPHTVPVAARSGRRTTEARATTEHVDARITRVVRRRSAALPVAATPAARATRPSRSHRASRITLTSAAAALAMFAASAMPAHASAGTSSATSTLAPQVRTQDYAVTQAVTAAALDRDDFTVGGGQQVVVAGDGGAEGAVSYGGEVRSPFPGPVRMSSGFGYRSAPCAACSSLHQGLDFNPGMGAPIGAVAAGTVRVSGTYFSYGTTVIIDHVIEGRRVSTLYGHMIPGSSPLRAGDTVEAGQFIGSVGSSGVSTGAHLHLEVLMDGVTPIDPEAWLEARIGRSLTI